MAGMVNLGEKQIKKRRKYDSQKKKSPLAEATPRTTPWRFVFRGRLPHRLLSYAEFRTHIAESKNDETLAWWTTGNYWAFSGKPGDGSNANARSSVQKVGKSANDLIELGFLTAKLDPACKDKNYRQYLYRITEEGSIALHQIAQYTKNVASRDRRRRRPQENDDD